MESGDRRAKNTVEVEFHVCNSAYPFVDASQAANCRLELEVIFPHSDDGFVEYFTLDGAPPERILDTIQRTDGVDAELVARHDNGGRLQFHIRDRCVAITVVDFGAIPRVVEADDGAGRVVAEVSSRDEAVELVDRFERDHPTVTVDDYRDREQTTSLFTHHDFKQTVIDALTDRQREVFLTAYMNGYYDWPRKHEAAELADELDITPATFSQHLRAVEGKIFSILLDTNDECVFVE
ncbi:bacterio-opsin activator domain-containing protein [Natrinema sp. SYSU A 869]|uniref:helix-turn-helix domain-containing protein n=1 Tax=Natrinema sp. SYSU A 869 TaxID=2871694 RepID=UPI002103B845|nr:bacterio-opsin activator domain-containing protein [Natrinema sp. SYSU A 869]